MELCRGEDVGAGVGGWLVELGLGLGWALGFRRMDWKVG